MYDGISNIELIRSAGLEKNITKKILSSFDTNINILKKRESANSVLEGILNTSSLLFPILLYILGSPFVLEKQMTLGKLVAMGSVLTFIIKPMISLAVYFPQFTMCAEIISRLREILLSEEKKKKGSAIIENVNTIEMDNVCFRYVANGNEVLHNVSLNAKNSQKIAIVGASGSGKTTITKLIMGLYDEYAGKIKINGKELSSICLESFQARSSIVTQVPLIVDGTIKENICWGATVDDEKIFDILKVCNLYEEVMKFPLNINTNVGEDGQNISGGQKQRIAIARALIKSPSILIFDEGTSNLDPVSERNIYQNIRKLGTIQIIVTHRYNTIIDADYIYLLANGEIIEQGNHTELIAKKGVYYENYMSGQYSNNL
jgi:ABC-type bacteriocin/lantibiotic exporter with double-glycine peptidase domain